MKTGFYIEDETHAEHVGDYESWDDAVRYLKKAEKVPWGEWPNKHPCSNTECSRVYEIVEFDQDTHERVQSEFVLEVTEKGTSWLINR